MYRRGKNEDSECDILGENYRFHKYAGSGEYENVRLFKSPSGRKIIVMQPVSQEKECRKQNERKIEFLQCLYPEFFIAKFFRKNYRAIRYPFPGKALSHYERNCSNNLFIEIMFAAIAEVRRCHALGMVVLDITSENVFYDDKEKRCYLIDGGAYRRQGEKITKYIEERADYTQDVLGLIETALELKPRNREIITMLNNLKNHQGVTLDQLEISLVNVRRDLENSDSEFSAESSCKSYSSP